jgi:hypothetical protein
MLSSALLSFVLSILHFNIFLFSIGVLTIHLAGTGWRFLYLRNLLAGQKPLIIDWALLIGMAIFSIAFIGMGAYSIFKHNNFGIIPVFFGITSIMRCQRDYKTYSGQIKDQNYWLTSHLERMTAAFIASLTAFLVNVVATKMAMIPALENFAMFTWITPAILIVPVIIKWKRKYRKQKIE